MKDLEKYLQTFAHKHLAVIFPHPDDESVMSGGLLLLAKKLRWETTIIILTGGEQGKNHLKIKNTGLHEVRKSELEKANKVLKADRIIQGSFPDSKLKETSVLWTNWLTKVIWDINPSLIVTYDHSGLTGHPDHISLSVTLKEIVAKHYSKAKLLWATLPHGIFGEKLFFPLVRQGRSETHYRYNLGVDWVKKWLAVRAHKSQHLGKTIWPLPLWLYFMFNHNEWYYKVDLEKEYSYEYVEFKI